MKLPRRVVFPFGYVVQVLQVPPEVLSGDSDSEWNADTRTITINKQCAVARRRYLLLHELEHALNDLHHWAMDTGVGKN